MLDIEVRPRPRPRRSATVDGLTDAQWAELLYLRECVREGRGLGRVPIKSSSRLKDSMGSRPFGRRFAGRLIRSEEGAEVQYIGSKSEGRSVYIRSVRSLATYQTCVIDVPDMPSPYEVSFPNYLAAVRRIADLDALIDQPAYVRGHRLTAPLLSPSRFLPFDPQSAAEYLSHRAEVASGNRAIVRYTYA